jgi:hypothetical protein
MNNIYTFRKLVYNIMKLIDEIFPHPSGPQITFHVFSNGGISLYSHIVGFLGEVPSGIMTPSKRSDDPEFDEHLISRWKKYYSGTVFDSCPGNARASIFATAMSTIGKNWVIYYPLD